MSQFEPTKYLQPKQNGNGAGSTTSLHGGAVNGLPLAAPQIAILDLPATANGNGDAPWTAESFDGEELLLPAGDNFIGLTTVLESLLFVAGEPVEAAHLAKSLDIKKDVVERGLARLADEYKQRAGGLRLQIHNERYQLVTAPTAAGYVEDFINVDFSTKLSAAALESLAIVAYRQPVTRAQVEAIRGVDSSGVLRSLVARGLIEETGRLDVVGRPILYAVTDIFLQHFGLTNVGELPPLGDKDADLLHAATTLADEDGELPANSNANDNDDEMGGAINIAETRTEVNEAALRDIPRNGDIPKRTAST